MRLMEEHGRYEDVVHVVDEIVEPRTIELGRGLLDPRTSGQDTVDRIDDQRDDEKG